MQVFHFAPGLFTTNPMPRIVYNPMTSPMVTPLVQGSRLDVALVVRGSQIVADNRADGVVGYAHVELILGLANSAAGWDS